LLKNCAVIAFLIFSICGLWGVYQEKRANLARLQQAENAKPKVIIVKSEPDKRMPHEIDPMIVQVEVEP
jgi:cbb3-type cytochrome oxidase subunit 3